MSFLSSLDAKDRRMLLNIVVPLPVLIVLLVVLTPRRNQDQSPVPSSYRSGIHGAKAAYTLLEQSGYKIEHWEEPLTQLATTAGPETVLIVAAPFSQQQVDKEALHTILERGGRVLMTSAGGGLMLPNTGVSTGKEIAFGDCEAQPAGLRPLDFSSSASHSLPGSIWINASVGWKIAGPEVHAVYLCSGTPVVVEYDAGKGHVVWWASSTPLENGSITRSHNLDLLLYSVGPPQVDGVARHVYWDESLHNEAPSAWQFTSGPVWGLLLVGSIALALLAIFSFSRRSGPVRALPAPPRATPIEFLDALGSLYRSAGAAATAVQIAWDRFRSLAGLLTGLRNPRLDAHDLFVAIERRFGPAASGMEADMVAAEDACSDDALKPRRALALVQALRRHEQTLRAVAGARKAVS